MQVTNYRLTQPVRIRVGGDNLTFWLAGIESPEWRPDWRQPVEQPGDSFVENWPGVYFFQESPDSEDLIFSWHTEPGVGVEVRVAKQLVTVVGVAGLVDEDTLAGFDLKLSAEKPANSGNQA